MRDGSNPDDHRDGRAAPDACGWHRWPKRPASCCCTNEKEIYGDIPRRCLDIVQSVGSEHLKVAWDAANFVQVGVRPYTEGYATLRPHLAYVQIKDARLDTGEVVTSGEGDGELVETIRALHADGFDGFFSLETHLGQAHARVLRT
jgi:sugar phosphate isomerase/epimerase